MVEMKIPLFKMKEPILKNEEPAPQNNQTWKDNAEAKEWLISKAKEKMCVVAQSKHVDSSRMEMVCERAGKKGESHKGKNYKYEKKTTRVYKTASKKCGCPFRIYFKRHHETDRWFLDCILDGRHSHPPPKSLYGHPAYARLKLHQMEKVRQMKGFRPLKILNAIRAEDKDNLSTISTIYASKATIKRTEWDGRLIMQQSEWLAEKLNYAMQTRTGPGDTVTHIFLAHPRMVDLAQCFYQVLFINATYKTNRYIMPMLNVVKHK
ncbi:uncharacterized protein LOC113325177 [Papaver somniferum]|uniref:uncharacterized protein LOC113325177 n=1 Tax=Papaver somniferum TaxID=3469 RepID=UPI000E6FD257|nr:uncharacterized protein LOC113325177 [Papaver somniferum]